MWELTGELTGEADQLEPERGRAGLEAARNEYRQLEAERHEEQAALRRARRWAARPGLTHAGATDILTHSDSINASQEEHGMNQLTVRGFDDELSAILHAWQSRRASP